MTDTAADTATDVRHLALDLAKLGYRVHPLHHLRADGTCSCRDGAAGCSGPGKHPRLFKEWQKQATTDPTQIEAWANQYPSCNWGILTDGVLVVDIDPRNGGPKSLEEFEAEYGPLPTDAVVLTGVYDGERGWHIYLRSPSGVKWRKELAPGIDLKSGNAYAVAPGGLHFSGVRYEGDLPPVEDLPEAPRWLVDFGSVDGAKAPGRPTGGSTGRKKTYKELIAILPLVGYRNNTSTQVFGYPAREHRNNEAAYKKAWTKIYEEHLEPTGYKKSEAEKTAASVWKLERAKPEEEVNGKGRGPSQATQLVELAHEKYDLVLSTDGETYLVPKDGPRIARPIRSGNLKSELAADFYRTTGKAATSSARSDAMAALEGEALAMEPEPVHLRVAPHDDGIALDLGGTDGRCAVVEPGSWKIADRPPVQFRRTELIAPAPAPTADGSVEPLSKLLNVGPESFDLIVGYLVAALMPAIQHPVLWFVGEQGTGKTSSMARLAALIDPSTAGARSAPRDLQEWVVSVSASYVVPLDNLSSIPLWLSDSICKAVTGDGLVRRKLYTDNDVVVNRYKRTLMLNGIDVGRSVATSGTGRSRSSSKRSRTPKQQPNR